MNGQSVWEYLHELRLKKVYKPKQRPVLIQIVIYVNELKVYKVAVFADERKNINGINTMLKIHVKYIRLKLMIKI